MTGDLLWALIVFAFVASITPGPNNLMLMTSGANFGFRRTIPHMLGIGIGFTLMVFLVGIGLMGVFEAVPNSETALTIASIVYLLWLAWKFANAGEVKQDGKSASPLRFWQAALFQWVNPKAWFMALSAITLFAPDRSLLAVIIVALAFGAVNLPCVSSWTVLGQQMQRVLTNPLRLRIFNYVMAALLVASLIPVVT
jgi:threonine/homoserine/homoserine lactone efflux protein